jgi:heme/copper-type cytochrome/quinol oxidase subunit 1
VNGSPAFTRVRPAAFLLAVWAALVCIAASAADGGGLARLTTSVRCRLTPLRSRDAGLTTVEVAIITAVLLGLATALVAAITVVVRRNTSKIQ